jgi:hypothetical protein
MFAPVMMPYRAGTTKEMLKFKPVDKNSIDFYFRVVPGAGNRFQAEMLVQAATGDLVLFNVSAANRINFTGDHPHAEFLKSLNG